MPYRNSGFQQSCIKYTYENSFVRKTITEGRGIPYDQATNFDINNIQILYWINRAFLLHMNIYLRYSI